MKQSTRVAVREKFAGEQIFDADSYPKGQSTWMCFDQIHTGTGLADDMLFISGEARGSVEARREGDVLNGSDPRRV